MFSKSWPDGLEIREMNQDEYNQLVLPPHAALFSNEQARFDPNSIYSASQNEKLVSLKNRMNEGIYKLQLGAFMDGVFAGWHYGRQSSVDTYYMVNSAVLPDFRRKNIYARILESTLECVTEVGFQCVSSQHHPSNNAVIIPKLKAGFWISGMEITDLFGLTVQLKWYPHTIRREVFEYRTGYTLPSPFITEHVLKQGPQTS